MASNKRINKITNPKVKVASQGPENSKENKICSLGQSCGGCQLLHMSYEEQLQYKQNRVKELLKGLVEVDPIIAMEKPYHYRNKVHAVFGTDRSNDIISGVYEAGTHNIVAVEKCYIEDEEADEIIASIRKLLKSFKMTVYNEDEQRGLLRHVLVRKAFATGQIMVVLVLSTIIFPSKKNFIRELLKIHPNITTIVINVNNRKTSMVLGDKEDVAYGKGYIEDILCNKTFKISSKSFYQVNPIQTELLYNKALEFAELKGRETLIDAYCGIGTIGIIASKRAKRVIGIELNKDAVKDALANAKINNIKNTRFCQGDATEFMMNMAAKGEKADVVMMDPPRSGSTAEFINAIGQLNPKKVVYVSCNPETLARDLKNFQTKGYKAEKAVPVDMFPGTSHVECGCSAVTSVAK